MTSSPIDEIKNRLDIVEVVGSYIKLQKAGANFRALCPFHSEKKPSLFVSPARQIWHCFGCNLGGDIFKFVMQIEGIEFGDALKILAQRAGVELKRQDPKLKTERQHLYEICELSCRFFEKQLRESKVGREAKKYLLDRGINEESIKKWRLGYAPNTWHGLCNFLISKTFKKEEIIKAGLAILTEAGNFYDRFRGRIIFPIFDLNSQVIGFGARFFENPLKPEDQTLKEETAKYINTPQTLLYDKSKVLYGLNQAKVEIRKKDFCILVEGYTDVIMSSQGGFQNVVATSGTALTPYQLKILNRFSQNLITAFDMDVAGDSATKRGIDLAQTQGFSIRVAILPEDSDPADLISKDPQRWSQIINQSKSILDFYFERTFLKFDSTSAQGKKEIAKILLPVIKRIPNKIEQSHWIQVLAKRLEVKEENVLEELKKAKVESLEIWEEEPLKPEEKSRRELLEERLLSLILKDPQYLDLIKEEDYNYFLPKTKTLILAIKNQPDLSTFANTLPEDLSHFFKVLSLRSEIEENLDLKKEISLCLSEIRNFEIKSQLDRISREIKKAEEVGEDDKINQLIESFNQLAKKLVENQG